MLICCGASKASCPRDGVQSVVDEHEIFSSERSTSTVNVWGRTNSEARNTVAAVSAKATKQNNVKRTMKA